MCTYSVLRLTKILLRLLPTLHKDIIADLEQMNSRLSEQSTTDAFELSAVLARLGISQYEEPLRSNGFEDWETVTAITETDMAELDFKRGDRRKLQRAIREYTSSSTSHRESVPDYSSSTLWMAGRCRTCRGITKFFPAGSAHD
jgi:hypothetical protein